MLLLAVLLTAVLLCSAAGQAAEPGTGQAENLPELLQEASQQGEALQAVLNIENPSAALRKRFVELWGGRIILLEGHVDCVSYEEDRTVLLIRAGDYTEPLHGPDFSVESTYEEPVYLQNRWGEIQEGDNITLLARIGEELPESGIIPLEPSTVWYRSGSTVEYLLGEEYTSGEMVTDLQNALNKAGFDCGEADGAVGSRTREAAAAFRASRGLQPRETIDRELAAYLRVRLDPQYDEVVQAFASETAEVGKSVRQVLKAAFRGEGLEGVWDMGDTGTTQASELADMSTEEIIASVSGLFTTDQYRSGILASVSLAQFILESDCGRSQLSQLANDLFGIKCSTSGNNWSGSTWDGVSYCRKATKEHRPDGSTYTIMANFRYYTCIEDSIADHSAYLVNAMNGSRHRYEGIRGCESYQAAAAKLQNGGYATSPTYAATLCAIIERYGLTKYDLKNEE